MNSNAVPLEATPIRPPAIVSPTIITTIEICAAPIMKRLNALMARPPEADVGRLVLSELTTGATCSSKVLLPEAPLPRDLRDISPPGETSNDLQTSLKELDEKEEKNLNRV